jgi:hypothetical protein
MYVCVGDTVSGVTRVFQTLTMPLFPNSSRTFLCCIHLRCTEDYIKRHLTVPFWEMKEQGTQQLKFPMIL